MLLAERSEQYKQKRVERQCELDGLAVALQPGLSSCLRSRRSKVAEFSVTSRAEPSLENLNKRTNIVTHVKRSFVKMFYQLFDHSDSAVA